MAQHPKIEKRRIPLYVILLIFQALSLFSNLAIIPSSRQTDTAISYDNALLLDLVIILLLTAFNMVFLYHFMRKKWLFYTMVCLLFTSIGINFLTISLGLEQRHFSLFMALNGVVILISLVVLMFSFYVVVRDIFETKLKITAKLLGAANLYLLIGSIFAFLYALMNIIIPGSIVPNSEISSLFHECVIKSSYILSFRDLPDLNIPGYVHNAMVFESLFAHLFAVFIVGRLLARD